MNEQCLRKPALDKELEAVSGGAGTSVTLLSLMASMSWLVLVLIILFVHDHRMLLFAVEDFRDSI